MDYYTKFRELVEKGYSFTAYFEEEDYVHRGYFDPDSYFQNGGNIYDPIRIEKKTLEEQDDVFQVYKVWYEKDEKPSVLIFKKEND